MGAQGEEQQLHQRREESNQAGNANRITESQFLLWKRQKDAEASARKAEAARKREEEIAAGLVQLNGRELFVHEPEVFDNSRY